MIKRNLIRRCYIIFLIYIAIFSFLIYKIAKHQVFDANSLSAMAKYQYSYNDKLSELNYLLLDHNGKELLNFDNKYYAVIDPIMFKKNSENTNSDDLFALIYILRSYNKNYDLSNIGLLKNNSKQYLNIDETTYNKLQYIKNVKGFYTYKYSAIRKNESWKIENLITSIKKPDGSGLKSSDSLEMQIRNKTSKNKYSEIIFQKDINGNVSTPIYSIPKNNVNVRLTLDKEIEDKIEEILNKKSYSKHKQIGVILMDSKTGEIRSMSLKDNSLSNVNLGAATENGYYPGSIFKVLVEETGIDRESLSLEEKFNCVVNKNSLCTEQHGTLKPEEAFIQSCNNIFAQIGEKVGFNNILDNAKAQGLFNKVLNFDCEAQGDFVEPISSEGGSRLVSIGQNMRITPIQAISIANTVCNDGIYVKPKLIDAYVDNDNNVISRVEGQSHRVISTFSASVMKKQMIEVVNSKNGTGLLAKVNGITVGGKTGTTTRMEKENSKLEKHSDGWFVGFFKEGNKYYSMVVFVKDIDTNNESAGNTAAPIFSDIVKTIYPMIK